jgi:DNA repair photolyase
MIVTEEIRKSILTRVTGYLKKVSSHSLNPYVGCGFGRSSCGVPCYVQHNHWLTKGRDWGTFVDVKLEADRIYQETYKRESVWARRDGGTFSIFFSSSTDPWQPLEKKYRVSRALLKAMINLPPDKIILQTHTADILEDKEIIVELAKRTSLRVHISLEGDREVLPGLPPPPCSLDKRIDALAKFSEMGIETVACLSPLYPLEDPENFFSRLALVGVSGVIIDHFIEGDGTRDGSRTLKTDLPGIMREIDASSVELLYRDKIEKIARRFLPVGISAEGFSGNRKSVLS